MADSSYVVAHSAIFLIISLAFYGIYYMPGWIAVLRGHNQSLPLVVLDLGLGWTVIGWFGCLAWSLMTIRPSIERPAIGASPGGARILLLVLLAAHLLIWAVVTYAIAVSPPRADG